MKSLRVEIVTTNNADNSVTKNVTKKRAGHRALLQKLCRPLISSKIEDLLLIVEATLLVRVRAPPETWTTKLCLSASLSFES